MDIISHYSAYTTARSSTVRQAGTRAPEGGDVSGSAFSDLMRTVKAEEKAELVRQLADGNSAFYANMRAMLKAQVEKTREDEEEQAIIDAMAAVLDAMSGRDPVTGEKASAGRSAADLTKRIGERIASLKEKDPDDPEIVKLENMLRRLQKMGICMDLSGMDGLRQDEDGTFETLTQLLTRRQAEELRTHPNQIEVNEPA